MEEGFWRMELSGCGRAWVRVRRERLRMRDIVGHWWWNMLSLMNYVRW
jgi:hypothetical protein